MDNHEISRVIRGVDSLVGRIFVSPRDFEKTEISFTDEKIGSNQAVAQFSVNNDGSTLNIALGISEVGQVLRGSTEYYGRNAEYKEGFREYLALSEYASYRVFRTLLDYEVEKPGVWDAFHESLQDRSILTEQLQDAAFNTFGSPDRVKSVVEQINETEIIDINARRIGSKIVLMAANVAKVEAIVGAQRVLRSIYDTESERNTQVHTEIIQAMSVTSDHAAGIVAEALIKRRGLGYIFPYSKDDLLNLRDKLESVDSTAVLGAQILETAIPGDNTDWNQVIDLSGGIEVWDDSDFDCI